MFQVSTPDHGHGTADSRHVQSSSAESTTASTAASTDANDELQNAGTCMQT